MPGKPKLKEKEIVKAFVPFLNDLIHTLGLGATRVAVDRQNFQIRCRDSSSLAPDVFLWGKGSPAFPPINGIPPPLTERKKKRKRDAPHLQNDASEELPPGIEWPWCVIPIEVKTEESRGATGNKDTFCQLGTYVREVFSAQEHRRFVPSLALTECTVEFLLWDREGVLVSERIDYHDEQKNNHILFCNMLAALVTWADPQLGFDPTVFYRQMEPPSETGDFPHLIIRVVESVTDSDGWHRKEVEYAVEETLFRPYTLRGRGSTCWRVRKLKDGKPGGSYLILDSWVRGGKDAEHDILRQIQDGRGRGMDDGTYNCLLGVAPLVHIDNVEIPGTTSYTDAVQNNRGGPRFGPDVDLVHTRTVLQYHGVLLEHFADVKEVLIAFHDVIKGTHSLP